MQKIPTNISFTEKACVYSYDYLKSFLYFLNFDSSEPVFTKKLYSILISSSRLLEDFLDFHGAKNNSKWYFFRELASVVMQISLASYTQRHLLNRFIFYDLADNRDLRAEGEKTLKFFNDLLIKLAPVIIEEARSLNISIPKTIFNPASFPGVITNEMLEYDIDDEDQTQQKHNIVKIASEFLSVERNFETFKFYETYSMDEMLSIVPNKVNEVEIRRYEMLVHNLQSSFDSYVIHGGYRFGNRKLKQFRSHFSVVYHLLSILGRLLHIYERHLHEVGYQSVYKQVKERLIDFIDLEIFLDRTINYALYYTCYLFSSGKKIAKEILNENIERSSIIVGIPRNKGFHSRPSLMVAKIVQYFGGQVEMCINDDRFDASSVLDLQWAGGKIHKEKITQVKFEGDVRALNDIKILAGVNYGEDLMGKGIPLPKELSYLK